jgi:hypothetical protein
VGSSQANRCLPLTMHLWYREQSTRARRKLIAVEAVLVTVKVL